MRHRISGRRLSRNTSSREALFKNLARALLLNEQIITTTPKAKELKSFVEKLITLGKKGKLEHRRKASSILQDEIIIKKLFTVLSDRYKERKGGYTRVIKAGFRYGDNAEQSLIELVDRDISQKGKRDNEYLDKLKKASNA